MSITLASLVARLQADVPQQFGVVPSTAQYSQAVEDAVADLGLRASTPLRIDFAIVAGTASYALPADFVKLIRLSSIGAAVGDVLITDSGLVPFSESYREQVTVFGSSLTIYPTPTQSATRSLYYAAGYVLAAGAYANLTAERATVAMLAARATCLELIAMAAKSDALRTQGGSDSVDTTQRAAQLRQTAAQLRQQYESWIGRLNSSSGGLSSGMPDLFEGWAGNEWGW